MSTLDQEPAHFSSRFSGQFQPDSNVDMVNTDQAKQANQEVIAFLEWLDRKERNSAVRNRLDEDQ